MKYAALYGDVFSVFSSSEWQAEGIATFPQNYIGTSTTEYIRVSVVASGQSVNIQSVSGQIQIEIFVPAGAGPKRAREIADKLEAYLAGKSFTLSSGRATQFFASAMGAGDYDLDNPSLYRSLYSIPFQHNGVL